MVIFRIANVVEHGLAELCEELWHGWSRFASFLCADLARAESIPLDT